MPITLKQSEIAYKDENGIYRGINTVAEQTTASQVAAINAAGTTQLATINTKTQQSLASISTVSELENMIEGVFDATKNYSAGKYVIQSVSGVNKLYKFTDDYTANSGWSNASVIEVKVGEELSNLKSALTNSNGMIKDIADNEFINCFEQESISGTRIDEFNIVLQKGDYFLSVDSIESSDTTYTTSRITFFTGSGNVYIDVNRITGVENQKFTLAGDTTSIAFYGARNYSDSDGVTFVYHNVNIYKITQLKETIDNNTSEINKLNDAVFTNKAVEIHKTHSNKYINATATRSSGDTGSYVKIYKVNAGDTYLLMRGNGYEVRYGFANTDYGNNDLYEGGTGISPIKIVAPAGYVYMYMQDITTEHPDAVCSVYRVVEKIDSLEEDVAPLVNNIANLLDRINGKYICHLGVSKNNDIIIPCQSLADISRAKRLGFNAIEINVRQTSDGKYVCLHGSSGAFGQQFTDTNGDSVASVLVNSMTLQEIKNGIRFKSNYDRYKTAPFTLQEMLYECVKLDMIPLVEYQSNYTDEIEILDSIMGKNNYLIGSYTYDRSEIESDAPMFSFLTSNSADTIVSKCRQSGGAVVAGLNVTNSIFSGYTEDDWKQLVNAIHSAGFKVSSAYGSEQLIQTLLKSGFDVINSTSIDVPEITNHNMLHITDNPSFIGFTHNGTIASGILTLANGNTVSPTDSVSSVFLGSGCMHIVFEGTITLNMGAISENIISDGKSENVFSSFYEERQPTFLITAVGAVTIKSLSFSSGAV